MTKILMPLVMVLVPTLLSAQDLESIPADEARAFGARLVELAGKLDAPQVKIVANAEQANGVHVPDKVGVLIVPQQDLKETEELAESFKSDPGAPLGYLFAYHIVPLVDGQRVEASRLRTVKLTGDDGTQHSIQVLLLAVRLLGDDDYRLHVYGKDPKPLIDAKFAEGTGPGAEPLAVEIKNTDEQTREGTVVVTVFGKYQASFRAGHQE